MPVLSRSQILLLLCIVQSLLLISFVSRLDTISIPLSRNQPREWLLATMSPAQAQRRRNIIRATWQRFYADPAFTMRFFIANPGVWMPLIEHENATYGDIIMLPNIEEAAEVATRIKPLEFYAHIADWKPWKYVSKLDDDSFLSADLFYREYILPKREQLSRTIIARCMKRDEDEYYFPGGQFYTISWEMVTLLARLYTSSGIKDEHEDCLVGRLLHEANEPFECLNLENPQAFDYDADNVDKWAWSHNITNATEAINPHKIKEDEIYLRIAAMYEGNGTASG